eukprot:scaffold145769_cov17-Tisochrysis_lutea.AAC.1
MASSSHNLNMRGSQLLPSAHEGIIKVQKKNIALDCFMSGPVPFCRLHYEQISCIHVLYDQITQESFTLGGWEDLTVPDAERLSLKATKASAVPSSQEARTVPAVLEPVAEIEVPVTAATWTYHYQQARYSCKPQGLNTCIDDMTAPQKKQSMQALLLARSPLGWI